MARNDSAPLARSSANVGVARKGGPSASKAESVSNGDGDRFAMPRSFATLHARACGMRAHVESAITRISHPACFRARVLRVIVPLRQ